MVSMNNKDIKEITKQIYEEGYKNLTGKDWEGSLEDLCKEVDKMELGGYQIEFKE
jgi:UDP-galactopyranose mutase